MSKLLIKIFLNGNVLMMKKVNATETLSNLRKLFDRIPNDAYFLYDKDKVPKEDENDITIEDIIEDKKIYMESETNNCSVSKSPQIKSNKQPIAGSILIEKNDNLEIYLYPNTKFSLEEEAHSKSMILLGEAGSGKTTLLNSIINYLTDINFEDNFRYKIIVEDSNFNIMESHASEVNIYYIHSHNGHPPIKIIDTPGFGDIGGIERDIQVIKKLENKFRNEINQINSICFVAQSSNARLIFYQKYIFGTVVGLFGNDIAENFVAMLTFCDGQKPQILSVLESRDSIFNNIIPKIQKPWYFKFNNSAIFSKGPFAKVFWEMGMENFKNFVKKLESLPAKSLFLSKEVLSERNNLNAYSENLQNEIQKGLNKIASIKKNNLISSQNFIKDIIKEGREILSTCLLLEEKIKYSFNHLKQIALNPDSFFSNDEFIESTMEYEKSVKKMGWKERFERLEKMKRKIKIIREVIYEEENREFNLFKNELNKLI